MRRIALTAMGFALLLYRASSCTRRRMQPQRKLCRVRSKLGGRHGKITTRSLLKV